MSKKNKVIKVFPHTYTNGKLDELREAFNDGWVFVTAILSVEEKGSKVYDYILEKDNIQTPPIQQ